MNVHKSENYEAISKIFNHPKAFRAMSDDLSPDIYDPPPGFYIMNEAETGVVRVDPVTGTACIVHIATTPDLWGKADVFTRAAIHYGFTHTLYTKILALIPVFNRLTISLCLRCGFVEEGRVSEGIRKNWKDHDMVLLGLTKHSFYGG